MKNYYNELLKLSKNCYSPYSNFKVTSIAVDSKGNEYSGVNIENSSFGATVCAERNAINSAIASGVKKGEIKEIHLIGQNKKEVIFTMPCGICRQVIYELGASDIKIVIYTNENKFEIFNRNDLLPRAFTGKEIV